MNSVFDDPEFAAIVAYFNEFEPAINHFVGFTDESPDFDHARFKFHMKEDLVGNIRYRTLHGGGDIFDSRYYRRPCGFSQTVQ